MPLTSKGKKIMKAMKTRYGNTKGVSVFYATRNKGKLKGVEKKAEHKMSEDYLKGFMDKAATLGFDPGTLIDRLNNG